MSTAPNAMMASGAFDRMRGTSRRPLYQEYNNFRIQTTGAPIIQGQINRLSVSELFFPYAIPTVCAGRTNVNTPDQEDNVDQGNDGMFIDAIRLVVGAGNTVTATEFPILIRLPQAFYTGQEMAAALQSTWDATTGPLQVAGGLADLKFRWSSNTSRLLFQNVGSWDATVGTSNWVYIMYPWLNATLFTGQPVSAEIFQKPRLGWTLGLRSLTAKYPPKRVNNFTTAVAPWGPTIGPITGPSDTNFNLVPVDFPTDGGGLTPPLPIFATGYSSMTYVGSPYSGRYTDYIDLCSTTLCANQYVRDGNTNQNVVRKDLIARIYIADEVSVGNDFDTGSRPFLIHRQYRNPKVMKWTADRSIDSIDLALFDMFGNPLPETSYTVGEDGELVISPTLPIDITVTGSPSDYALTFHVYESEQNHNGYH